MIKIFIIVSLMLSNCCICQNKATADSLKSYKPEIFTSGFIDIMNSGQVNASARFIRLFIGEPGKLAVPLSLYCGVSNNNFQGTNNSNFIANNEQLVTQYINPLCGLINISTDGVIFLKKTSALTKTGILYHVGERVLTGYKAGNTGINHSTSPVNFLNSYLSTGCYFQTGAWERTNSRNLGIFWLALRYIGTYSNPLQIQDFLPAIKTNGIYHGWSAGFGVEINRLVNLKAVYYKYLKQPEIDYTLPIYQLSFNYTMKD